MSVEASQVRDTCLHVLLEAQAARTPDAIAVTYNGQSLTYRELHWRANQLARALNKRAVRRGSLVGLCVERSLEMVAGVLAILKSGAAYVPIDPAHGVGRIGHILADAQVSVLITEQMCLASLPRIDSEVLLVDSTWRAFSAERTEGVTAEGETNDLAYVIFTSGSTGKPKGVEIEHRSLVNLLLSMEREPGFVSSDVLLAVTTLAFDIAGLEIFLPLLTGGRVVIAPRSATYDGVALGRLLETSRATVMQATPVTWRLLIESGWKGNRKLKALVGGEALPAELSRQLVARTGEIWNLYGPTETTIWSTIYRVTGKEERTVPIGKPVANTTLYVLDAGGTPLPAGEVGELHIGGDGLARGYRNRDELTRERFVNDPFSGAAGARMYRTGDVVRQRADGALEFLGRTDHQVKIRGFRIELGEIESVLEQQPEVRQAVVIARESGTGEKELAAYVAIDERAPVTAGELRRRLGAALPDYMLPATYVRLEALPLTANGKVDRGALPEPKASDRGTPEEYIAPRNDREKRLARLWKQVLGVDRIGVKTSFFELGGQSITAARLFMRISREFGMDLPLSTLFHAPTIELLARELERGGEDAHETLVAIQTNGERRPFFCVHGGAGSTLFLHSLARRLANDQPFYAFEPEGLNGQAMTRTTVEAMASAYVAAMRKVQPEGPYWIGGYCFGGIVAVEIAQQLRRCGEQLEMVALLSAPLRFNRLSAGERPRGNRLAKLMRAPRRVIRGRWLTARFRVRSALELGIPRLFLRCGYRVPQMLRTGYVDQMLRQAECNYVARFYEGALHLFRGRGLWDENGYMGWEGLAERIENRFIGDGETQLRREIMDEPLVGLLAAELSAGYAAVSAEQMETVTGQREEVAIESGD